MPPHRWDVRDILRPAYLKHGIAISKKPRKRGFLHFCYRADQEDISCRMFLIQLRA